MSSRRQHRCFPVRPGARDDGEMSTAHLPEGLLERAGHRGEHRLLSDGCGSAGRGGQGQAGAAASGRSDQSAERDRPVERRGEVGVDQQVQGTAGDPGAAPCRVRAAVGRVRRRPPPCPRQNRLGQRERHVRTILRAALLRPGLRAAPGRRTGWRRGVAEEQAENSTNKAVRKRGAAQSKRAPHCSGQAGTVRDLYGCKVAIEYGRGDMRRGGGRAALTALAAGRRGPWDAVAAKGFLDAPGGWGADALVGRECLLRVRCAVTGVAVQEVQRPMPSRARASSRGADVAGDGQRPGGGRGLNSSWTSAPARGRKRWPGSPGRWVHSGRPLIHCLPGSEDHAKGV